jgi:hypothetical protein
MPIFSAAFGGFADFLTYRAKAAKPHLESTLPAPPPAAVCLGQVKLSPENLDSCDKRKVAYNNFGCNGCGPVSGHTFAMKVLVLL